MMASCNFRTLSKRESALSSRDRIKCLLSNKNWSGIRILIKIQDPGSSQDGKIGKHCPCFPPQPNQNCN